MKMLLIGLAVLLAGLVLLYVPVAYASMSPWQLFQHLCPYVSPGSPQCVQQPQQANTPLPPSTGQQQTTTPYCTTNPNDPACQQQLQQQQVGPPPDLSGP